MATYSRQTWPGNPAASRWRDRRPCRYEVYLPDFLSGRRILLEGEVSARVSEAETALARLDTAAATQATAAALGPLLQLAEAVASSRIAGHGITPRQALGADAALQRGEPPSDSATAEVLGHVDALDAVLQAVSEEEEISADLLLEAHGRLLGRPSGTEGAGALRALQSWIGGSSENPCSADYVPPPADQVPELFADLCAFCNEASLPPVAQAALAQAQLETIRPFLGGNGRMGRLLALAVLCRRGLAATAAPSISVVLASRQVGYREALTAARYTGSPSGRRAHAGTNQWIAFFAAACARALAQARRFEEQVRAAQEDWRQRLGTARADSAVELLILALPSAPLLTATAAAALIGRTFQATNQALGRLVEIGALTQVSEGPRNRVFEAPELVEAFEKLLRGPS
jgi:Fic family protein